MAKANRMKMKQKHGSSRKNYFLSRTKVMKPGSKGNWRYLASIERNKNK